VRVGDAACPFCRAAIVHRAGGASAAVVRGRLSRAALFAAGATLMSMSACSDPKCAHGTCTAGIAGMNGGGAGGSGGGAGGSGGGTAVDAGTDVVIPSDGPVAIYSAVFPPPQEAEPGAAFARAKDGKPPARS
jgi:hypothetical protein